MFSFFQKARQSKIYAALLCYVITITAAHSYEESAARYALIIGNKAYPSAPLINTINDARDIAEKLEGQDFKVSLIVDAGATELQNAITSFYQKIEESENSKRIVSLVYYAGHAVQIKHRNYLVPVDLEFIDPDEFFKGLFDVNDLLENIPDIANMQNIIVLDACRDNPFKDIGGGTEKQLNDGLAPMRAPVGTLIAYSTEPGSVASDGAGENGLYTTYLLEHMGDKITIEEVFKKVRKDVAKESNKSQIPWEHSSLYEDVYINAPPNREVPELMSF